MSHLLLPHDRFVAEGAAPERWALLCHGILGSRRNWRSFARRLVALRPELGVISVDLRNHGDSPPADGPHTLSACAQDLARLAAHLGLEPEVLIGHSFGGKVVLRRAADLPRGLRHVWVLDSRPDPIPPEEVAQSDVRRVIDALTELPAPFAHRQDVVGLLTARGFSRMLARWMTTNLQRADDGLWHWRFELAGVEEMITDYYAADLRSVLSTPVPDLTVHVVRAALSDRWPPEVLDWFDHLPAGAPGRIYVLEDADHWVHVDNPTGLLEHMDAEL